MRVGTNTASMQAYGRITVLPPLREKLVLR